MFDKSKEYNVSVSECLRHPTKAEVAKRCEPLVNSSIMPCVSQAKQQVEYCKTYTKGDNAKYNACFKSKVLPIQACFNQVIADGNRCFGATVYQDFGQGNIGIRPVPGGY